MPPPTRISLPLPLPLTTPLPPSLRSTLNTALLASSSIHPIHASLLTAAHSSGWLDSIRARALQLLREAEGEPRILTYRAVLDTVVREAGGRGRGEGDARAANWDGANGVRGKRRRGGDAEEDDEDEDKNEKEDEDEARPDSASVRHKKRKLDVRVPDAVISAGVKVVREVLEGLVDVLEVDGEGEGEGR